MKYENVYNKYITFHTVRAWADAQGLSEVTVINALIKAIMHASTYMETCNGTLVVACSSVQHISMLTGL